MVPELPSGGLGAGRRLAARAGPGRGRDPAVRRVPARPVLHESLRLLRLQHLHRRGAPRSEVPPVADATAFVDGGDRGAGAGRAGCWTGCRRWRRSSSAAAPRPCSRSPSSGRLIAAVGAQWPLAGRRRDHHRGQSGVGRCGRAGSAARGRLHPDLVRHAVGRAARARHVGPGALRRPRRRGWWPRRNAAGFAHTSVDLIYGTPGESLADWRVSRWRRRWPPDPTTSVRTPWWWSRAPGWRSGSGAGSSRRPIPTTSPTSTCWPRTCSARPASARTRSATGPPRRPPAAGTTWVTGAAQTGGGSARARTATSAGSAGGTSSTRRGTPARLADGTFTGAGAGGAHRADRQLEQVMLGIRMADGLAPAVLTPRARARLPELQRPRPAPAGARPGPTDRHRAAARRRRGPRPPRLTAWS